MTERVQDKLGRLGRPVTISTFGGAFAHYLLTQLTNSTRIQWPDDRYANDPVVWAEKIVHVKCWDRQAEMLQSIVANKKTAVSGGRKIGKSCSIAISALHWYCTRPRARVYLISAGFRQIEDILWSELRYMFRFSGQCWDCYQAKSKKFPCEHSALIDGTMAKRASTGLEADDLRSITGFAASGGITTQGMSGPDQLYLLDEATGIDDEIYNAVKGNLAGGGHMAAFANPTRPEGWFFNAFGSDSGWKTFVIPSTDSPNVKAGYVVVPGLAEVDYIEDAKREWGEDSVLYKVHVLGQFALDEDGKIISVHNLQQAQQIWEQLRNPEYLADDPELRKSYTEGRLFIGVDPAGDNDKGDDSAFAARIGKQVLEVTTQRGLTEAAHLIPVLGLIAKHNDRNQLPPVVTVDANGIGYKVYQEFEKYLNDHPNAFTLVSFRTNDAPRQPELYGSSRDELWADAAKFIKDGGAVPPDPKLIAELHCPKWNVGNNGKYKVTDKDIMRRVLHRSTDRADAVCMSIWEATPTKLGLIEKVKPSTPEAAALQRDKNNPYAARDYWEMKRRQHEQKQGKGNGFF